MLSLIDKGITIPGMISEKHLNPDMSTTPFVSFLFDLYKKYGITRMRPEYLDKKFDEIMSWVHSFLDKKSE